MIDLSPSEQRCVQLASQSGSNFYVAFRLLPKRLYVDLCVIYAWLRTLDDLSDGGDQSSRESQLNDFWACTQNAFNGVVQKDARWAQIVEALPTVALRYKISVLDFKPSFDGAIRDLSPVPFKTFDDLNVYCDQVAGSVGQLILKVGKVSDADQLKKGLLLGRALQYTNIARDVAEDQRLARSYIPQELLVAGRPPNAAVVREFLKSAALLYQQSVGLEDKIQDKKIRVMVSLMRQVYLDLFKKIQQNPDQVFLKRVSVHPLKKTWLFSRAFLQGLGS